MGPELAAVGEERETELSASEAASETKEKPKINPSKATTP